jgi:hypothetical protein
MRTFRWAGIYGVSLMVVIIVRFGLWITRYQRIRALLVRPCDASPAGERKMTVARITHAVAKTARIVPDASCLTQCIACQALLSWKGIPSSIAIGLKKAGDAELKAHAWLVWHGQVVLQGESGASPEFNRILDLPTPVRASATS